MQFHLIALTLPYVDALVVVINSHRQGLFCLVLPDDVLIQDSADVLRFRDVLQLYLNVLAELLLDNFVTELNTFITDVDARSGHKFPDLFLRLAAE